MPNTVTIAATKANTTRAIEYSVDGGLTWADANIFTAVPAGTLAIGQVKARLVGSPIVLNTWGNSVIVFGTLQDIVFVPQNGDYWDNAVNEPTTMSTPGGSQQFTRRSVASSLVYTTSDTSITVEGVSNVMTFPDPGQNRLLDKGKITVSIGATEIGTFQMTTEGLLTAQTFTLPAGSKDVRVTAWGQVTQNGTDILFTAITKVTFPASAGVVKKFQTKQTNVDFMIGDSIINGSFASIEPLTALTPRLRIAAPDRDFVNLAIGGDTAFFRWGTPAKLDALMAQIAFALQGRPSGGQIRFYDESGVNSNGTATATLQPVLRSLYERLRQDYPTSFITAQTCAYAVNVTTATVDQAKRNAISGISRSRVNEGANLFLARGLGADGLHPNDDGFTDWVPVYLNGTEIPAGTGGTPVVQLSVQNRVDAPNNIAWDIQIQANVSVDTAIGVYYQSVDESVSSQPANTTFVIPAGSDRVIIPSGLLPRRQADYLITALIEARPGYTLGAATSYSLTVPALDEPLIGVEFQNLRVLNASTYLYDVLYTVSRPLEQAVNYYDTILENGVTRQRAYTFPAGFSGALYVDNPVTRASNSFTYQQTILNGVGYSPNPATGVASFTVPAV